MSNSERIQFDLIKLLNGERLIRLTDLQSGLSLEKKLQASDAVRRQTDRLRQVFEVAIARADLIGA